jgi:hypothetical protein
MVITLDPELERALSELARRRGVSPEALALAALRAHLLAAAPADESRDEWERRLRRTAADCGVSRPDAALSSEGLYE